MRFSRLAIGSAIVLILGFSVATAQPPAGKLLGIKRVTKAEEKKPTEDKLPMTSLTPAKIIPNNAGTSPMWLISHKHKLANATIGMGHVGSAAHAPDENVILANYWRALRATTRLYSEFAKA